MICPYCFNNPHITGCPNAPEAKSVYVCKHCKEGILEGEEFVRIDDNFYHLECLEDLGIKETLELAGVEVETAEEE